MENTTPQFEKLINILEELREKCPWDKKQTIHTLRQMTLEETYELADAITETNWAGIKEELGDMLLHIIFYAKIATEEKQFTLADVIDTICAKLIRRHPHIYPPSNQEKVTVHTEEDVKRNWEKIKLQEGKKSVLSGVPHAMPAVIKAMRLQEKAKQIGFEWEHKEQVWQKVEEEIGELQEAIALSNADKIEDEFGDVIFSLINYARFIKVDAENALERTNKKFVTRFKQMEQAAGLQGLQLENMTLQEMDEIWNAVKKENKS